MFNGLRGTSNLEEAWFSDLKELDVLKVLRSYMGRRPTFCQVSNSRRNLCLTLRGTICEAGWVRIDSQWRLRPRQSTLSDLVGRIETPSYSLMLLRFSVDRRNASLTKTSFLKLVCSVVRGAVSGSGRWLLLGWGYENVGIKKIYVKNRNFHLSSVRNTPRPGFSGAFQNWRLTPLLNWTSIWVLLSLWFFQRSLQVSIWKTLICFFLVNAKTTTCSNASKPSLPGLKLQVEDLRPQVSRELRWKCSLPKLR